MAKPFKTFHVEAGTYDYGINVVISEDLPRVTKYVRWKLEDPTWEWDLANAYGCVIRRKGSCPILWLPKRPKTPRELATLGHEVLHIVCCIMDWAGIDMSGSSEEAYAHLQRYLMQKILERLSK